MVRAVEAFRLRGGVAAVTGRMGKSTPSRRGQDRSACSLPVVVNWRKSRERTRSYFWVQTPRTSSRVEGNKRREFVLSSAPKAINCGDASIGTCTDRQICGAPLDDPVPLGRTEQERDVVLSEVIAEHRTVASAAGVLAVSVRRVPSAAAAARGRRRCGVIHKDRGRPAPGVSREWGDDGTRGTIGRVENRLGERECDGCCG
jgi:hypothetical protein